jgi:KaiC/GvpD/RAD55 family RecA-like ATPase
MKRIKTYIERLDEQLEGGIPTGTVSLICGTPGCMKSSLAYSILYKNALEDNLKGLYITLEQEIESLKKQMEILGMAKESGNLTIVDHKMIDKQLEVDVRFEFNSIKKVQTYLGDFLKRENFDLIAIDPLNALYSLTSIKNPRREIYNFFTMLRGLEVTSLAISEMHQGDNKFGKYGVEDFLSDAIIHMDYRRDKDILERYLGIVKMRYTNHDLKYFPLFYNKDRFVIYTKEELEL